MIWDDARGIKPRLETEADWVSAGEVVFDAAIFYDGVASADDVRTAAWYKSVGPRLTPEGLLPFTTYVVREKGKVELGNNACGFCHTRVMTDGQIIKGAQGNFEFDRANAYSDQRRAVEDARIGFRQLFGAPWLKERDPAARVDVMTHDEILGKFRAIPGGVAARHRASIDFPPAIPDLIGLRDRKYLDRTGLVRQRDIGDVMRYAALNNEIDLYSNFGGFTPAGKNFRELPQPTDPAIGGRYSDEQLYALAKYLYSFTPRATPIGRLRSAGKARRSFGGRGAPPATRRRSTRTTLVPADGFTPPADHFCASTHARTVGAPIRR